MQKKDLITYPAFPVGKLFQGDQTALIHEVKSSPL